MPDVAVFEQQPRHMRDGIVAIAETAPRGPLCSFAAGVEVLLESLVAHPRRAVGVEATQGIIGAGFHLPQ